MKALKAVCDVVIKHHGLISACMVDFITKDVFSLVSDELAGELLKLSDEELRALPQLFVDKNAVSPYPNIAKFVAELRQCTLESLPVTVSQSEFLRSMGFSDDEKDLLQYFDRFMSDKKMHEVVLMSDVVIKMSAFHGVHSLLDLGSGKAYLSQVITARSEREMKVLAVDASSTNSSGAEKRSRKLEVKWFFIAWITFFEHTCPIWLPS